MWKACCSHWEQLFHMQIRQQTHRKHRHANANTHMCELYYAFISVIIIKVYSFVSIMLNRVQARKCVQVGRICTQFRRDVWRVRMCMFVHVAVVVHAKYSQEWGDCALLCHGCSIYCLSATHKPEPCVNACVVLYGVYHVLRSVMAMVIRPRARVEHAFNYKHAWRENM